MQNIVDKFIATQTGKKVNQVAASGASPVAKLPNWRTRFSKNLEEMVVSFLDFPSAVSQDFRDTQFARHLLWRVGDERTEFIKILSGVERPEEMDFVWRPLMPYITGKLDEDIPKADLKLETLRRGLYWIVRDLIITKQSSFTELMDRVIEVINEARRAK